MTPEERAEAILKKNVTGWLVLDMIRDRLIGLGCKCGPDAHESTPPMMYPEWINCCLIKRIEQEREACAKVALHDALIEIPRGMCGSEGAGWKEGAEKTRWAIAAAIRARSTQ